MSKRIFVVYLQPKCTHGGLTVLLHAQCLLHDAAPNMHAHRASVSTLHNACRMLPAAAPNMHAYCLEALSSCLKPGASVLDV